MFVGNNPQRKNTFHVAHQLTLVVEHQMIELSADGDDEKRRRIDHVQRASMHHAPIPKAKH